MIFQGAQEAHLVFLKNSFLGNPVSLPGGTGFFSEILPDCYWNYFKVTCEGEEALDELIASATPLFAARHKPLCLVFEADAGSNDPRVARLLQQGFEPKFEEVWMFRNATGLRAPSPMPGVRVQTCETDADLEVFLSAFFAAFGGADPREPYGALPPEYAIPVRQSFVHRHKVGLQLYNLYVDETPAACAMLGVCGEYAGLYSLGVRPEFRGRGLGAYMTQFRMFEAAQRGAKILFLQTEGGSYNEKLFSSFGFVTAFQWTGIAR